MKKTTKYRIMHQIVRTLTDKRSFVSRLRTKRYNGEPDDVPANCDALVV